MSTPFFQRPPEPECESPLARLRGIACASGLRGMTVGRPPSDRKYCRDSLLSQEVNAQESAAVWAHLGGLLLVRVHDDSFPGLKSTHHIIDHQPLAACTKTFLHVCLLKFHPRLGCHCRSQEQENRTRPLCQQKIYKKLTKCFSNKNNELYIK